MAEDEGVNIEFTMIERVAIFHLMNVHNKHGLYWENKRIWKNLAHH